MAQSQAPYICVILADVVSITWYINKPLVRLTTVHYQSAVSMISFAQVLTAQWSDTIPCQNVQFQAGIPSHDILFQQEYLEEWKHLDVGKKWKLTFHKVVVFSETYPWFIHSIYMYHTFQALYICKFYILDMRYAHVGIGWKTGCRRVNVRCIAVRFCRLGSMINIQKMKKEPDSCTCSQTFMFTHLSIPQ